MPSAKATARISLYVCCGLLAGLASTTQASVRTYGPAEYSSHRVTCDHPVRLTHDCSVWDGATRPIAFGAYRMTLAAGRDGRTILLSQIRPGPDHNGYRFRPGPASRTGSKRTLRIIECLRDALEQEGIRFERMQTVRKGHRVAAYYLEFSANAYDYLKQFTVLESEHWLPKRAVR